MIIELLFFIVVVTLLVRALDRLGQTTVQPKLAARKMSPQLKQALTYAERLYSEKRYITAERAYVAVLKLDHKNLQAYNRLGIIYSAQKNLREAIECFEVAARLLPSATTYFNLGLAFYENRNYVKAIAAIRKAIMFEPAVARYVALAKACDKIADNRGKLEALEAAAELGPTRPVLLLLRDAYRQAGKRERLAEVLQQLRSLPQP